MKHWSNRLTSISLKSCSFWIVIACINSERGVWADVRRRSTSGGGLGIGSYVCSRRILIGVLAEGLATVFLTRSSTNLCLSAAFTRLGLSASIKAARSFGDQFSIMHRWRSCMIPMKNRTGRRSSAFSKKLRSFLQSECWTGGQYPHAVHGAG